MDVLLKRIKSCILFVLYTSRIFTIVARRRNGKAPHAVVSLLYAEEILDQMLQIWDELIDKFLVEPKVYVVEDWDVHMAFVCFAREVPYSLVKKIEPNFHLEAASPSKTTVILQHLAEGLFPPETISVFLAHAMENMAFHLWVMPNMETQTRPLRRVQISANNIHMGLPPDGFMFLLL